MSDAIGIAAISVHQCNMEVSYCGAGSTEQQKHLEQLVRTIGGSYAQLLQQLHHQATEAFECPGQSYLRVDLYQNILVGVYIQTLHHMARQLTCLSTCPDQMNLHKQNFVCWP